MPKFGLLPLLLVFGVATIAVGSYSALAGPGPVPNVATLASGSQQADNDAGEAPSFQEQEGEEADDAGDGQGTDKIAQAIGDEFGVAKEDVLALHDQGIGFGALFKLYALARAQGISVDQLLATIPIGEDGEREFGFGQLRKALTDEQRALYESGPKNLGHLVSNASKKHNQPDAEGEDEAADGQQSRGKGHVPPGQAKKLAQR